MRYLPFFLISFFLLVTTNACADHKTTSDFGRLWKTQRSNIQVYGTGRVSKLLSDDNKGSRHQRFIVTLPSKQTLLIAHNIDLAPRIESLSPGDKITFYGEYEWNAKGGVVHWTHRDPNNRHPHGYLLHEGEKYW